MSEHGSATIVGAGILAALAFIGALTMSIASVATTKTELEASADMAALAAARTLHDPLATTDPCAVAGDVSSHEVSSCVVDHPFIHITTTTSAQTLIGPWDLEAEAKAGPVMPER